MALNPDKSDAMLLGTRQHSRTFVSVRSVDVAGCSVSLSTLSDSIFSVSLWTVTYLWINTSAPSANLLIITSGHSAIFVRPSLMIWPNQSLLPWSALA